MVALLCEKQNSSFFRVSCLGLVLLPRIPFQVEAVDEAMIDRREDHAQALMKASPLNRA
jgi:hypothetical protein